MNPKRIEKERIRRAQRITNRMALDFCRERLNCPWIWKKQRVAEAAREAMRISDPMSTYKVMELFWDRYHGIDGIAKQIDETGVAPISRPKKETPLKRCMDWYRIGECMPDPLVPSKAPVDVNADAFLLSYEWRRLRMEVIKERGARCECCGASPKDGIVIHVDHIKPRRKYPELALSKANLQVLCEVCNHGKGNWDQTDWRKDSQASGESSQDSPYPDPVTARGKSPTASPRPKRKQHAADARDETSDLITH